MTALVVPAVVLAVLLASDIQLGAGGPGVVVALATAYVAWLLTRRLRTASREVSGWINQARAGSAERRTADARILTNATAWRADV